MTHYVDVDQGGGTTRKAIEVESGLWKRKYLVSGGPIEIPHPDYGEAGLKLKFHPTEGGLWIEESEDFDFYRDQTVYSRTREIHPIDLARAVLSSPGFKLGLMPWGDGMRVPISGKHRVIVGTDNNDRLHIRIFDQGGDLITDTDETKLPRSQAEAISALKQKFPGLLRRQNLTRYDLRLMSALDRKKDIPRAGKRLIVVAAVKDVLHFRIFDGGGKRVVDTDGTKLTTQAGAIEDLRKQLESLWSPHKLTYGERAKVRPVITSIVGHPQLTDAETRQVLGEAGSIVGRNLFPCKIPPTIDPEHVAIASVSVRYQAWQDSPEREAWYANLTVPSPPRQPPGQGGLTRCESDCLKTIREIGRRAHRDEVIQKMREKERGHGKSTIRNALSKLVSKGVLTKPGRGRTSKGYGLPEWETGISPTSGQKMV
jgi:hypothetical protein